MFMLFPHDSSVIHISPVTLMTQICGNHESVDFINEWLRLWHEKGFRTSRNCSNSVQQIEQDVDYNCYPSDSDSGDIGEEDSLKNVLLVTGPVGVYITSVFPLN